MGSAICICPGKNLVVLPSIPPFLAIPPSVPSGMASWNVLMCFIPIKKHITANNLRISIVFEFHGVFRIYYRVFRFFIYSKSIFYFIRVSYWLKAWKSSYFLLFLLRITSTMISTINNSATPVFSLDMAGSPLPMFTIALLIP